MCARPHKADGRVVEPKRAVAKEDSRCSLLDHREVVEVDLAILWVAEETLEVVEVILAVVETGGRGGYGVEVVEAEVVMEEAMVDIMDLVMVATMAVVLIIVAEGAMVVVGPGYGNQGGGYGGGGRG
ncbi:hypothetical protein P7K49_034216 [Saguinus oedipus]|uniref:Uncharacterized protein n=1 Tax=Saguinus oedipus TaxID=9490 RepID=A0ABQ9TU57_SAGOE|nr:hypothetical protein P7K49_034216 [Saguinus oedipus]